MANELTNALAVTNGGRTAEILGGLIQTALHDATDLRSTMIEVPYTALGSATIELTIDAAPVGAAAHSSEISTGLSNTAYTTAGKNLTIAGYGVQYEVSDLFGITGAQLSAGVPFNVQRVVQKIAETLGLTMTDLLCALFPSLSNSVVFSSCSSCRTCALMAGCVRKHV